MIAILSSAIHVASACQTVAETHVLQVDVAVLLVVEMEERLAVARRTAVVDVATPRSRG